MILWLLACSMAPYPDYWPNKSLYPDIKSVEPALVEGRMGGETITVTGNRLDEAVTVVVSGRNAEIVNVDTHSLQFLLPALPAGTETVALSVVTKKGAATREAAMTVTSPASDFTADENASVALLRYDCPIEGWGVYADGEEAPFGWCGSDMGYATAEAWLGNGSQSGYAAELAQVSPLAELPPVGTTRVYGPNDIPHPGVALAFKAHGLNEAIRIQTPRDFAADLAFIEDRQDLLEVNYYWADSISEWTLPFVTLYDDDECWLGDLDMVAAGGDTLDVDGDASGATGMTMGFGIVEEYEDFTYEDWATTATAFISGEDGVIVGSPSGVELQYDDYSGWFFGNGPAVGVAMGDFPPGEYVVSTTNARGTDKEQGYIEGPTPLDLWNTWPDLTVGYAEVYLDEDLEVEWVPAPESEMPTIIAIEIMIYDMDTPHPNGTTQVARLVARGDDSAGRLVISQEDLEKLPSAPNMWDDFDESMGYWGDMSITRHQLRKVRMEDGDLVVDFIHTINGPVRLSRAGFGR
jgi:hypothetical protein